RRRGRGGRGVCDLDAPVGGEHRLRGDRARIGEESRRRDPGPCDDDPIGLHPGMYRSAEIRSEAGAEGRDAGGYREEERLAVGRAAAAKAERAVIADKDAFLRPAEEWKGERERDLDGLAVAERKRRAEVGLVGGSAGGDGEAAGRRLEMERRGRQVERRNGRRELLVDGAGRKDRRKGAHEICVGER